MSGDSTAYDADGSANKSTISSRSVTRLMEWHYSSISTSDMGVLEDEEEGVEESKGKGRNKRTVGDSGSGGGFSGRAEIPGGSKFDSNAVLNVILARSDSVQQVVDTALSIESTPYFSRDPDVAKMHNALVAVVVEKGMFVKGSKLVYCMS